MARCIVCDKTIGMFSGNRGMCQECYLASLRNNSNFTQEDVARMRHKAEEAEGITGVLLTTESQPSGLKILKRIEIVTAECAFGMNIFQDLFASTRNIVGGRSEAVQATMRESRRTALNELKREAVTVGANAVIGVDLDYVELASAGTMVMLVASGTAVVIEDIT